MKTKAVVLVKTNQPLRLLELEIPKLKPGQVMVNIAYSGVCRSQLNEVKGINGKDEYLPHTLGHEGSGVVLEVGQGVKKVKPGDHVVLTWIKGVGCDVTSTIYQNAEGSVNSGAISTFMQKTVISENRLVVIPKEMPLKEAALLGCAVPTGAGIVLNSAKVKPGDTVAVFGAGGIGSCSIIAASAMDAEKIIALDFVDHKLELAQQIGATHVVNVAKNDPLTEIMNITDGKGVDYAIESAGRKVAMETAFQSVRYGGGTCILAGNLPYEDKISLDPMELIRGKKIVGTWGGETKPDEDIPKYVDWYLSGRIKLSELITDVYQLIDINLVFDDLGNGKVLRALIELGSK